MFGRVGTALLPLGVMFAAAIMFLAASDDPGRGPPAAFAAGAGRLPAGSDDIEGPSPAEPACTGGTSGVSLHVLPFRPVAGRPLRMIAVSRRPLDLPSVGLTGPGGSPDVRLADSWGPGPFAWEFVSEPGEPGEHVAVLRSRVGRHACVRVYVASEAAADRVGPSSGVWPIERAWDSALEDLYSAWVARLFRVPPDFTGGWRRLSSVLRSRDGNVLYGALGWSEDGPRAADAGGAPVVRARADCGDMPYALRAYFSWKFRLPFRFRRCDRSDPWAGVECRAEHTNLTAGHDDVADPVERFSRFLEVDVAWSVHSATGRTLAEDDAADFYPVELSREALRPGTVFVYPHGHLLVVAGWHEEADGRIMPTVVDGHPDGTVTFKRFSERFFPYLPGTRTAGFKAFRPVEFDGRVVRPVGNDALASSPAPAPFSEEQYRFSRPSEFHEAIRNVAAAAPGS